MAATLALAGVVIGAFLSHLLTIRAEHAQWKRDDHVRRIQQRTQAYCDLLGRLDALMLWTKQAEDTGPGGDDARIRIGTGIDPLINAMSVASLVGSERVAKMARDLATGFFEALANPTLRQERMRDQPAPYWATNRKLLVNQMREELGLAPEQGAKTGVRAST